MAGLTTGLSSSTAGPDVQWVPGKSLCTDFRTCELLQGY